MICAAEVPCGSAAHKVFDTAGVGVSIASNEQNVTSVLTKVQSGEADVGLVYRTDVLAAGDTVTGVEFPEASAAVNSYSIAVLTAPEPRTHGEEVAQAFVDFVLSDDGQAILAKTRVLRSVSAPAGPRDEAVGVPALLWLPAALAIGLLVLPVVALFVRADWASLPADVTSAAAISALTLSLVTSVTATGICVLLGVPLAVVLARSRGWPADILRALVTLPLVLPPTVGGIALLFLLGRRGLIGQSLNTWFGLSIPFTTTAVIIAQTFVAMPFLVLGVEGSLRTAGTRYEAVGASLGASRWTVLRRITLPLVMPGLVSGTVLCFARALGEFGATALFAGNAPGVTRTMPLAIYSAFNGAGVTQGTAVALSLLLVVAAVAVLLAARAWRPGRAAA